ncbi:hypothetical protein [Cytobacillus kochii]|uniref:hypothetical protein n=1 Tax=Cytobacillus kochii TaxID=859143 RepID=UPI00402AA54D
MKAEFDRVSSRRNPAYAPMVAKEEVKRQNGRIVGVIAVKSCSDNKRKFNPYTLAFTVSRARKDFNQVVSQMEHNGILPTYEQSLFYSCFKKWRVEGEEGRVSKSNEGK